MSKKRSFFRAQGSPYLFDNYTNAIFGYSFQKLRQDQVYCCRIERDSDNAQTDLELEDSGSITMSTAVSAGGDLNTWIGSNTANVVTWYDQSGNGYDLTQTAANSGTLVTAGTLEIYPVISTNATIRNTSFDYLDRAALTELDDGNDFTIFTLGNTFSASHVGCIVSTGTSTSRFQMFSDRTANKFGAKCVATTTASALADAQYNVNDLKLQVAFVDGASSDVSYWKDGTAGGQNQAWTGTYTNDTFRVGYNVNPNYYNGHMIEIIGFSDDKTGDRTDIESDLTTRYGL